MKKVFAKNRKAYHDYSFTERECYEAGMSLKTFEVKAIQNSNISLKEAFISSYGKGLLLKQSNVTIPAYMSPAFEDFQPNRNKPLLLNKKEIKEISTAIEKKGFTCIPLEIYRVDNGPIKIKIAIAKGKSSYDKRESIKERDIKLYEKKELKKSLNEL